ncbi:MAG: hydroxyacid dehydrogenase [Herpetosiphonaceae bacterium]|nr:hydroxyacid dehydrogenase [Herpetosiphonaceae bacterium]
MRTFRVALTGDFCDSSGQVAYGNVGQDMLQRVPYIRYHFIREHMPDPHDASYFDRLYSLEVTPKQITNIDGLIVLRPWVKSTTFAYGAEQLVVIGRSGAGYDKIDLDACTDHDVAVFNAPAALTHSTASSALTFMLALAKRLPQQDKITRAGRWDLQSRVMGNELPGHTLGIIGLGHTGRELARLVAPFAMRLIAYSPHADPEAAAALGVELLTLDELLQQADFVSLHCRLTLATHRLLGAAELARMRPTAYLINVARGELIDQTALVAVLREHRIAGAALDVFEHEPLPVDDPLIQLDNVILTPHFLPATAEIWTATGHATTAGMLQAARGVVPDNVVNHAVLDRPGFQAKLVRFAENRDVLLANNDLQPPV